MSTADIATLRLRIQAEDASKAADALDELTDSADGAEASTSSLTKATDILAAGYQVLAKAAAAYSVVAYIKEATDLALRYETLGIVMRVSGNNAGYTNAKMLEYQKTLQSTGISMTQSRNSLIQMATANIDLAKSQELARTAQNLAVVANINSSDALERMIEGIQSGEAEVLKTLGLNVSFSDSYKKMETQLGMTTDKMSEQQKMLIRTNTVLKEATAYQGIYEQSLTSGGKALSSMNRLWEDLKVKVGGVFLQSATDMIFRFSDALKEANTKMDGAVESDAVAEMGQGLATGLKIAAEAVLVLGANFVYVFSVIGAELAGFAAGMEAVVTGKGWTGMMTVSEAVETQTNGMKKSLDAYTNSLLDLDGSRAKAAAAKTAAAKELMATEEAARIKAGNELRAREADEAKNAAANDARKAAGAAAEKKRIADYMNLINATNDKAQADRLAMQVTEDMTKGQEYALKIMDDMRLGLLNLTDKEKARLAITLENMLAAEQARLAQERAIATSKAALETELSAIGALEAQAIALEAEVDNYGKSTIAINDNTMAKLRAQLATGDLNETETASREAQLRLLERINLAQSKLGDKKAATKLAENVKSEWESTVKTIEKTFHDGFIAMLDKGNTSWSSWAQGLKKTFKSAVADELYKMFAQPFIAKIGTSMTGGGATGGGSSGLMNTLMSLYNNANSNSATGGGTSTSMTPMGMLQMGKTLYSGFSGAFTSGLGTMIGNMGTMFGSAATASFGSGMAGTMVGSASGMGPTVAGSATGIGSMGGTAGSAGASAGSMVPIVGWIAAGMAASNALYKKGWDAQNGSMKSTSWYMPFNSPMLTLNKTLQKLGVSNGLANMLSGASTVSRLFGRKNPELTASGLEGSLGGGGFSGNTYQDILEKGGVFRSDKRYTNRGTVDKKTDTMLDNTIQDMMGAVKNFGSVLGIEAGRIDGYSKKVKLTFGTDDEKNQQMITDLFAGVGDELATRLLPTIQELALRGESASAALERVATNYAVVDAALTSIGMTFGPIGVASLAARERLVKLTGGLEALTSSASFFAQNFLTEAERMAPVADQVGKALADLGLSGLKTRDDFKAVILELGKGGKLATAEGAKIYAGLMAVQEGFAMLHPEAESAARAIRTVADVHRDLAGAYDDESRALKTTATNMRALSTSMRDLNNSHKLGDQSTLTPEQRYAEARKQFDTTATAARSGDTKAQGKYEAAFAAFLASSSLVNSSSATYKADEEYAMRATDGIASWADGQATNAERQLSALDASVSGILQVKDAVLSVKELLVELRTMLDPKAGSGPSAPGEYTGRPNPGTMDSGSPIAQAMAPVVTGLQQLNAQFEALRLEQQGQTGDLLSTLDSTSVANAAAITKNTSGNMAHRNWKLNMIRGETE